MQNTGNSKHECRTLTLLDHLRLGGGAGSASACGGVAAVPTVLKLERAGPVDPASTTTELLKHTLN